MNTDIRNHFNRAHQNDISMEFQSIYPSPVNLSIEQLIMKALLKNIPVFLVAIGLIFLVACTSTSHHESTGQYIDDSVITSRVKAAILADDSLKVAEINVETYKGVVQLSGFVSSMDAQYEAVKVAKNVGGVKSVKNDMHVK
jgi:hyperosmotically inducible protein